MATDREKGALQRKKGTYRWQPTTTYTTSSSRWCSVCSRSSAEARVQGVSPSQAQRPRGPSSRHHIFLNR